MALAADFFKHTFQFRFRARTSRGLMRDKVSWFIRVWDDRNPSIQGIGECGPLPGLSPELTPEFESTLAACVGRIQRLDKPDVASLRTIIPPEQSAIMFALETALLDLNHGGSRIIYRNRFLSGSRIPINGLIWMGDMDFMMNQINEKIAEGFRCIKLKVGGLDFDRECDTLDYLRKRYFREDITIRLDANGAFKLDDVLFKLTELAKFNIHSIEQPIKPGLPEMEQVCRKSPIPVAFDEELIGVNDTGDMHTLLSHNKPAFIILKPTLHGGLTRCAEWIECAESLGIGWWITSALESAVGLNAICQFTANYNTAIHQGLGTGSIYANGFDSPLSVERGEIFMDPTGTWDQRLANRQS